MDEDCKQFLMKEVEIIQSTINRMASTSFLIKGWTITLVVGILLLNNWNSNETQTMESVKMQILIAFVPIGLFWILDSYFLRQERLYRKLYDWVIENRPEKDDHLLSLNTDRFKKQVPIQSIPFSSTFRLFYGGILVPVLLYTAYLYFG